MTNSLASPAPWLAGLPIAFGLFASVFGQDFWMALPLTVVLTVFVGTVSYLSRVSEQWPLYALAGGAFGWIASVALLSELLL